jgi:hypothetical protein
MEIAAYHVIGGFAQFRIKLLIRVGFEATDERTGRRTPVLLVNQIFIEIVNNFVTDRTPYF